MRTDISDNWKYSENSQAVGWEIPDDATDVDLPVDLLRRKNRNYHAALGQYGSYYDPVAASFYRVLPTLEKCEWIVLEVEGVAQFADVYVNGAAVAHIEGAGKHFIDLTQAYRYGAKNLLKLSVWAPQMAGRYVGAGITGGVRLHTHKHGVALREDGVFVRSHFEGGKAHLGICVELTDKDGAWAASKRPLTIEATVCNARGKKAVRKARKCKLKNMYLNIFELKCKLSRYCAWSPEDPYLYTVTVTVRDEFGKVLDEGESTFGIVERQLSPVRGLLIGGRTVKLKGAVLQRDNGIMGMESTFAVEEYKLSRIKSIGYNAVRYTGMPSEAALCALDTVGLYAEVDLFETWAQGEFPYDGHVRFAETYLSDCERFVCQLRKHPSVTVYGLNADAAETYGRGEGARTAEAIAAEVRGIDDTRPLVLNASERVPLREELDAVGIKGKASDAATAIGLGRERDLFGKLTEESFACADIAGYAYLYPRYASDRAQFPKRLFMSSASYPSRAFESADECEKNPSVAGDFAYCGADYLGYPLGKPTYEDEQLKLLPPHTSFCGDLDLIYNRKPAAYYRSILFGNRAESLITVRSPSSRQLPIDKAGYEVKETHSVWNWPHDLGKQVEIEVYSGGEVVALYRDGKLIGRKLAGRVNRHIATFKTEYYPGTLTAVGYHKGRECSRTTLSSVSSPRAVKLSCERKSRVRGEQYLVEIAVVDKEGRVVPYASREVELSVTGGTICALGSADPEAQAHTAGVNTVAVYDGKALAVLQASPDCDGKIVVKATGDGLLSGKISLKVK